MSQTDGYMHGQVFRETSNIMRTLVGNRIHSRLNTWLQWIGQQQLQNDTRNI